MQGSATDTVSIIHEDSPDTDFVIKDTHSKGRITLEAQTVWNDHLPEHFDAVLLRA